MKVTVKERVGEFQHHRQRQSSALHNCGDTRTHSTVKHRHSACLTYFQPLSLTSGQSEGSLSGRPGCSGGVAGSSESEMDALQMCVLAEKTFAELEVADRMRQVKPDPGGSIPRLSAVHSHKQRNIK